MDIVLLNVFPCILLGLLELAAPKVTPAVNTFVFIVGLVPPKTAVPTTVELLENVNPELVDSN